MSPEPDDARLRDEAARVRAFADLRAAGFFARVAFFRVVFFRTLFFRAAVFRVLAFFRPVAFFFRTGDFLAVFFFRPVTFFFRPTFFRAVFFRVVVLRRDVVGFFRARVFFRAPAFFRAAIGIPLAFLPAAMRAPPRLPRKVRARLARRLFFAAERNEKGAHVSADKGALCEPERGDDARRPISGVRDASWPYRRGPAKSVPPCRAWEPQR